MMKDELWTEAAEFFSGLGKSGAAESALALGQGHDNPEFRVCIAGNFSCGKTHLLNGLLGSDLFPEDVLPATTVLTRVIWGPEPALRFRGEETVAYEASTENLEKFCAENELADAAGVLEAEYPADFLKPGLAVYDTPGVDDILARRADITISALDACDAALVVTSAVTPLRLNEKQFMDSYLYRRAMPRLALVVTFLDRLAPEQAARQVSDITRKAEALFPGVEVWLGLPVPGVSGHVAGPEEMRARLGQWAASPDLARRRARMRAKKLAEMLLETELERKTLLRNLRGDRARRERELERARLELSENAQSWQETRQNFLSAGLACAEREKELVDGLLQELRAQLGSGEPEDFGRGLRSTLREATGRAHDILRESLERDTAGFMAAIRERYAFEPIIQMPPQNMLTPDCGHISIPEPGMAHGIIGLLLDFGEKLLNGTAALPLPVPPALRPVLQLGARELMKKARASLRRVDEEDREAIAAELEKFCLLLGSQARLAVERTYGQLAEQIRGQQLSWLAVQQAELEKNSGREEVEAAMAACESAIARAAALREKAELAGEADE